MNDDAWRERAAALMLEQITREMSPMTFARRTTSDDAAKSVATIVTLTANLGRGLVCKDIM